MNTLLAPQRSSNLDALHQDSLDRRAALLDRLALRVGLWLLLWSSRRPRLADDRDRHRTAHRHRQARAERERADHARRAILAPRL